MKLLQQIAQQQHLVLLKIVVLLFLQLVLQEQQLEILSVYIGQRMLNLQHKNMTSITCLGIVSLKLFLLHSIWAIVPIIYAVGFYSSSPKYEENVGDIILN